MAEKPTYAELEQKVTDLEEEAIQRKALEKALLVSEERYRNITEDQTEFIVRWLPDGTRTFANKAYFDYFGLTQDECIGISLFPLIFKVDRKAVKKRIELLNTSNPVSTGEHRVILPSGKIVWNQWVDRAIFNDEGQIIELQSVGRDITEHKKTENTIRRLVETTSSKFGEAFFDTMSVQMSRVLDADYTLIGELRKGKSESIKTIAVAIDGKSSDNFEYELTKTPCENVIGKEVCSYPSGVWKLFPEDVLLKEMSVEGYVGVPLFDSKNLPIGIMVALFREPLIETNFTESILQIFSSRTGSELERLWAEETLRGARLYTDNLIQTANVMIIGLDSQGNIQVFNPAAERITGYTKTNLEGKNWFETLVPRDRYPEVWDEFSRLMSGGLPKLFENPIQTKNGKERLT